MTPAPRLYLDIDGCVCPLARPDPEWGDVVEASVMVDHGRGIRISYEMNWAPALVTALDGLRAEFGLELVWLSTWVEEDAVRRSLVPALAGLNGGRILPYAAEPRQPGEWGGWWKVQRLLEDQARAPGPFIWVDDVEVALHGWRVFVDTRGITQLMIAPEPRAGLRRADIEAMREWLQDLG